MNAGILPAGNCVRNQFSGGAIADYTSVMSKPFDATLKELIRSFPVDWLVQLREPITAPPEVLSADLSTVSAAADTLIRVGERVVHIELETGPDDDLATRMLVYNVLAHRQTGLPVRSVAVLLRAKTGSANRTNRVEYEGLSFQFEIVKVWEIPAEELLKAGLGLVPLAVLGRAPSGSTRERYLPTVVERIAARAERESPADAGELLMSAFLLAGMHNDRNVIRAIFQGVLTMRDNVAYQMILEEGAVDEAQHMIAILATSRYGEPTEREAGKLSAIEDLERLHRLALRVHKVDSWDALLRGR